MGHEIATHAIATPPGKPDDSAPCPVAQAVPKGEGDGRGSPTVTKPGSSSQPPRESPVPGLLRFRDQALLAGVSAAALVAMIGYCVRTSHWGTEPIELERQPEHVLDYQIDLNGATWVEWSQLPGIGSVLARRIVQERQENGPFRSIEDLTRVKGIGAKKLDAIRAFIREGPSSEGADER